MYRRHFGLDRFPFDEALPADQLFPSREARETAARLDHLLQLRGIGLLTGEPGCGKTSACRRFAAALRAAGGPPAYVSLTTGSVLDAYQAIGWAPGLEVPRYRARAYRAIRAEVSRRAAERHPVSVPVVDEAHHLHSAVLEELRLLTSYRMDAERRLCLLLAGHGALRRRLAMAAHASLRQRLVMRHHLRGLRPDEVRPYLAHRLRHAGCERDLFEPAILADLHTAARGLPRAINRLAHCACLAAAADQADTVGPAHLRSACREVQA